MSPEERHWPAILCTATLFLQGKSNIPFHDRSGSLTCKGDIASRYIKGIWLYHPVHGLTHYLVLWSPGCNLCSVPGYFPILDLLPHTGEINNFEGNYGILFPKLSCLYQETHFFSPQFASEHQVPHIWSFGYVKSFWGCTYSPSLSMHCPGLCRYSPWFSMPWPWPIPWPWLMPWPPPDEEEWCSSLLELFDDLWCSSVCIRGPCLMQGESTHITIIGIYTFYIDAPVHLYIKVP